MIHKVVLKLDVEAVSDDTMKMESNCHFKRVELILLMAQVLSPDYDLLREWNFGQTIDNYVPKVPKPSCRIGIFPLP